MHRRTTARRLTVRRIVLLGLAALVVVGYWLTLAPRSLGGPASYIVVDGVSMQPKYHTNDLVIVHRQAHYHLGEIVEVNVDGGHVIHRLWAGNARIGWTTHGINKNTPDLWVIPNDHIDGSAWLLVPQGGRWLRWMGTAEGRALLLAVLATVVVAVPTRRRRPAHLAAVDGRSGAAANALLVVVAVGVGCIGMTIMYSARVGLGGLVAFPWVGLVHPRTLGIVGVALLAPGLPLLAVVLGGIAHARRSEAAPTGEEAAVIDLRDGVPELAAPRPVG